MSLSPEQTEKVLISSAFRLLGNTIGCLPGGNIEVSKAYDLLREVCEDYGIDEDFSLIESVEIKYEPFDPPILKV